MEGRKERREGLVGWEEAEAGGVLLVTTIVAYTFMPIAYGFSLS